MSQALEALMSLSNDDIATYSSGPETEAHIVVGDDRLIHVPGSLKRIAVQYDHNIETVTFDCPRYWDNHDMSEMQVYINYKLGDGTIGSYIAQNVAADGDLMHFNWTISRDLTYLNGGIIFLICVKKTDDNGNEVNHWNSELCTDLYVSPGLEGTEIVESEYPDIITQLLTRMDTVETINVQASEMREILAEAGNAAEIANSAITEAVAVKESIDASEAHIRDSYANAIKHETSGSFVRANDVSPIEHNVKVKVRSKNLIPFPYDELDGEKSSVTFTTLEDGGIQVVGTPTANASFNLTMQYKKRLRVEKGKTYTISVVSTLSGARGYVFIQNWANDTTIDNHSIRQGNMSFVASDNGSIQIGIVLLKDQVYDEVMYIWLEEGEVATDYTPYVDVSTVSLTIHGKNLLPSPYFDNSGYTTGGITYTVLEDGSIHAVGTATANSYFRMMKRDFTGLDYVLTDCTHDTSNKFTYVWVMNGQTVDKIFRPQVELGSKATEREAPKEVVSYTPASDGTVEGVRSVSPVMSVVSDKPGVIIDVEYNKDLNSIFDEINSLLEQLLNGGV